MECELLQLQTVDKLKLRIPLLRVNESPKNKIDFIKVILKCMSPSNIKNYWDRLNRIEQLAVAESIYNWGGAFHINQFKNKYNELPDYFIHNQNFYGSYSQKKLGELALFFYDDQIPDEFIDSLKAFVLLPKTDAIKSCLESEIPKIFKNEDSPKNSFDIKLLNMNVIAVQDLSSVLRLVEARKISVSEATGHASAESIKIISEILVGGDYFSAEDERGLYNDEGGAITPIRAFAWPLLLQTGGLAKRIGKKLELTSKGSKALKDCCSGNIAEPIKTLYCSWRDNGMFDEFRRIDLVKGQQSKGNIMTSVFDRRDDAEKALKALPVGQWVQVDEIFRFIQSENIKLNVTNNPWQLYLLEKEHGSLGYSDAHDFEILGGRYLLVYMFEYLATLGILDVAYVPPYGARHDYEQLWGGQDISFLSRYDGLLYVRLNALGAWCIGSADDYQPIEIAAEPFLKVDEHLNIILLREPLANELLALDQFTVLDKNNTRKLTKESILNALENNFSLDLFLEFLKKSSELPLLGEVAVFFDEFNNRNSALIDGGTARLINCNSVALARMVSTDPSTSSYCQLMNDNKGKSTILVVPSKSETALRKGLKKLGYILPNTK